MRKPAFAAMGAAIASLCFAAPVHAEGNRSLITVTQQRAADANDESMGIADRQRELANRHRHLREAQREADALRAEAAEASERSVGMEDFFDSLFGVDRGAESTARQQAAPLDARRPLGAGRATSEATICRVCGVRAAGEE